MKNLKFEFVFAPSYDPKMKRPHVQTSKIQNRWDARRQKRLLIKKTGDLSLKKVKYQKAKLLHGLRKI